MTLRKLHPNSLTETRLRQARCILCPLHEKAGPIVPATCTEEKADILFIAEAPTGQDIKPSGYFVDTKSVQIPLGLPLAGLEGSYFKKLIQPIRELSLTMAFTYAVKQRPPKDRSVINAEYIVCASYLAEEIYFLKPKLIVCLGPIAERALSVAKEDNRLLDSVFEQITIHSLKYL